MKDQAYFFLMAVFLFFLPSVQLVSVICIAAMVLLWLVTGGVKISFEGIKQDKKIFYFTLFYLAHLGGLLYTSNFSFAFFDLQSKTSFLIFPLVLPAFFLSSEQFGKLKLIFVSGCTIAAVLCLYFAKKNYSSNPSPHYFYYTYYSHFLHPSYFSMYLILSILFLLDELKKKWNTLSSLKKVGFIVWAYILFINIIMLSARTANVVAFFIILLFLIIRFWQDEKRLIKYIVSILCLVSLFLVQYFLLNQVNRFDDFKTVPKTEQVQSTGSEAATPKEENETSLNLHQKIWEYSLTLGLRNPVLGVGTGDVKDELVNVYRENNFNTAVSGRLNCHNQFLNTFVTLGLLGLITLLLIYYIGMRISIQTKDWIYFSFLLIVFLNSMTESIFEKQNGILFFASFNMLFYLRNQIKNQDIRTKSQELATKN